MSVDAKDWEESYDAFMRATAGGIVIPEEEEADVRGGRARRADVPSVDENWFAARADHDADGNESARNRPHDGGGSDGPRGLPVAELFATILAAAALPAHDGPEPRDALTPELLAGAATTRANLAAQEARDTRPLTAEQQEMVDAIEAEAARTGRSRVDLLNARRPLGDRRADGGSAHDARQHAPEPEAVEPTTWPDPPADAAYHGVLGDIARAVAPYTEADPIGILGTLLAMFGAACGGGQTLYQGSLQRTNLSIVVVGGTGFSGRKGTSLDVVRSVYRLAYPELDELWLVGVASGEAITGHFGRHETEERALIVETEFGRLLTIMNREGSTLSAILRNAWDGVPLGHARARDESLVTRHHVTIIGHITPIELRGKLTDTDAANGFANRLLFLAVRRTQLIPFPTAPDELVRPWIEPLHRAIVEAHVPGEMAFDDPARDRWEDFYAELAMTPRLGLAGAVTGRHEAQVARLSLVYALADRSTVVGVAHLEAAIALADYARRSAVWALGDSTGNRHADALRRMLVDGPFGWDDAKRELGLRAAADMADAVAVLVDAGLADVDSVSPPRGGRPRRILRAKGAKGAKDARGARAEGDGITT